jgi:hypothetical protein
MGQYTSKVKARKSLLHGGKKRKPVKTDKVKPSPPKGTPGSDATKRDKAAARKPVKPKTTVKPKTVVKKVATSSAARTAARTLAKAASRAVPTVAAPLAVFAGLTKVTDYFFKRKPGEKGRDIKTKPFSISPVDFAPGSKLDKTRDTTPSMVTRGMSRKSSRFLTGAAAALIPKAPKVDRAVEGISSGTGQADDDYATIKQSKKASFSDVVTTVKGLRGPNKGAKAGSKLPPVDRGRATYVPRNAISDPAKGTGEGRKGSKKPKGRTVTANLDPTGRTIDNFLRGMFSFAGSLDKASDLQAPKSRQRKNQAKGFKQFMVK